MLDKLVERLAVVIANRVVEEVFDRLPDLSDLIGDIVPAVAGKVTEELLDRLPFPFR